uniref:T-cell receptor alpha/delta variable 8.0 n=1 Tax=Sinocyclocheilus grahami TaxID=75366 RepID=A0A672Q1A4_SINGR
TIMFLFCWTPLSLFIGNSFADTIQPSSSEKHIFRGANVTLSCNYSGLVYDLQWYRNFGGFRTEFLILVNENSEASEPSLRLSAKDSKEKKQVNLTISSAEVTDSALYYCALRPTVTESPEALYKNSDSSHFVLLLILYFSLSPQ